MKKAFPLWALVLLLTVTGCQPQPASPPAFSPSGAPAYLVDFNHPVEGECALLSEVYGDYYCKGGELHIVNRQQGGIAGFYFTPPQLTNLKNFMLEASMHLVSEEGSYGVQFRIPTGHESYSFWVRPTGDFQFRVMSITQDTELVPWTRSSAIHKGTAVNLLQVTAIGPHFTLFANGQELASLDDDSLAEGWPGVLAWDNGHAAVSRFSVWRLP